MFIGLVASAQCVSFLIGIVGFFVLLYISASQCKIDVSEIYSKADQTYVDSIEKKNDTTIFVHD
jgi:hypothetical protein